MITFDLSQGRFVLRVAAIILHEGHVLLHRAEQDPFWSLPGGRAEILEPSVDGIRREMQEELGAEIEVVKLQTVLENFYESKGIRYHEVNLCFLASLQDEALLDKQKVYEGIEACSHPIGYKLLFRWFPLTALDPVVVLPAAVKDALQSIPGETRHIIA